MRTRIARRAAAFVLGVCVVGCSASGAGDFGSTAESVAATQRGVDYSYGRPSPSGLRAAGYTFAARYLSHDPSKDISADEANALQAAGVDVVANWEAGADDALGGYGAGVAAAQAADAEARSAGMPADRPIYFSVDFDAAEDQQGAINAYFDGVASVIGVARTGAYGGYYVVKRLFDAGKIHWGWQTSAWSGGQWDGRAQLHQVDYDVSVAGGDCDVDEAVADDFGQWSHPTAPSSSPLEGSQAFVVPNQQHYLAIAPDGSLRHTFWDGNVGALSRDTWGSGVLGTPVTIVINGQQHAFARGTSGALEHWYWEPTEQRVLHDTWAQGIAGDPAAALVGAQQHVWAVDDRGTLQHWFWEPSANAVLHDTWGGAGVAGRPTFLEVRGQQHVFARGTSGALEHWFWDPTSNRITHDTWATDGVAADPAAARIGDQQHVWAVDGAGNLQHWFWDPAANAVLHDTWGSGVAGRPSCLLAGDQQHVFARGTSGTVEHWFWDPASNAVRHDTWGSGITGDPTALLIGDQQHVWALDAQHDAQHWFWIPEKNAITHDDWSH